MAYEHCFDRLETIPPLLSDDSAMSVCRNGSILADRSRVVTKRVFGQFLYRKSKGS